MEDNRENKVEIFSAEIILVYCVFGLIFVGGMLRFVWGEGGLMTTEFSYQRILVVLSAIAFGFGLGWLLYPRQLGLFKKADE